MSGQRNAHCSYCGAAFTEGVPFPRTCGACAKVTYVNPIPVAVLVLPVDEGVLTIRRGIEPRKGQLALPGGFIDLGEAWRAACAREVFEETGIRVDADAVTLFDVHSAPDGTLLVFGAAPKMRAADLPPFVATNETSERVIVNEPLELCFPLHTRVLADYFTRSR
ncbi:MAG: NUDIX domain-containing protein [Labilithrix sp.]|nr:NUDIX domain-containing protein [Labilithrix sp.]MCW5813411.1 NUDIX domain-containing protein [Labilithrix sp.]